MLSAPKVISALFSLFFCLALMTSGQAQAEHSDFEDDDFASDSPASDEGTEIEVETQSRSVLDLDETQLEQVITTTLQLQSDAEKKRTIRITIPAAISDSASKEAEKEEARMENVTVVPAPQPIPQTALTQSNPSAAAWVAVMNPLRWLGRTGRTVSSMPEPNAETSFGPRKIQKVVEIGSSTPSGIGLGSVKMKPAAQYQRLDQKIAAFFERFRNAFGRAQAKQSRSVELAGVSGAIPTQDDRGVGSINPLPPPTYQGSLGGTASDEFESNPMGITLIAVLGWLGFLFCVFLMYRLRSTVKPSTHASSHHRPSNGRKTWKQSYPHGETVVNPRGRK